MICQILGLGGCAFPLIVPFGVLWVLGWKGALGQLKQCFCVMKRHWKCRKPSCSLMLCLLTDKIMKGKCQRKTEGAVSIDDYINIMARRSIKSVCLHYAVKCCFKKKKIKQSTQNLMFVSFYTVYANQ